MTQVPDTDDRYRSQTYSEPTQAAPPTQAPQALTPQYVRYALIMLLVIYTLNFVDRGIINILAGPIKKDLGISDSALGLLMGIGFAFFYTILGLPIARFAEHANRAKIISFSVVIWSAFTALSGLAQNYWHLLAARVGVGVGEAGCTPPAHSLISDYVPAEKRASAIAFYSLGVPIGSAMGLIIGATIADAFGWRWAFAAVGIPGVLIGIVAYFTLKEPRILGLVTQHKAGSGPSLIATAKELTNRKSYWYVVGAATMISFLSYGKSAFIPVMLSRVHGLSLTEIGTFMALGGIIAGVLGTMIGGYIADRAAKTDVRAYMTIPMIAFICSVPFFLFAMFADNAYFAMALLTVPSLLNSIWYGPVYAAIQGLVGPQSRATAVALMLSVLNMIGLGVGPFTVGALSDILTAQNFALTAPNGVEFASFCAKGAATAGEAACTAAQAQGLRLSLAWHSVLGVLVVAFFLLARKTLKSDMAEVKALHAA
jgi:MFS transporter, Spinster family, sphingosine-1-phosphate transporter